MQAQGPLPGGRNRDTFEITDPKHRCGTCPACQTVEQTKRLILADSAPAGPGIGDAHARMWNQILANNPCQQPKE